MPINDQKDTFYWLLSQAKDCLLEIRNPGIRATRYLTTCCLQQSAEFTFKAVIASLANREVKTRNTYTLIKLAAFYVPELNNAFPRDSNLEKKLFHFLKPAFIMSRGQIDLLPNDNETEELIKRIQQIHEVAEMYCIKKIDSP